MSGAYESSRGVRTPEEHSTAVLLRTVLDHCARPDGTLDSYTRRANAPSRKDEDF
jgi:hypothetical protein